MNGTLHTPRENAHMYMSTCRTGSTRYDCFGEELHVTNLPYAVGLLRKCGLQYAIESDRGRLRNWDWNWDCALPHLWKHNIIRRHQEQYTPL